MSYVYIQSEPRLWTVGFYKSDGEWEPESDHSTREEAAERVHWLNGGSKLQQQGPVLCESCRVGVLNQMDVEDDEFDRGGEA